MDYTHKYGQRYSFQNTLLVISPFTNTTPITTLAGRGKVEGFSPSSGARMRKYLRNSTADYRYMLTLTYPGEFSLDGRECKDHLRRLIQELKRSTASTEGSTDSFSVFWFMEFQKRGAFHFHIFLTHKYPKEFVSETWYRIVGSGDPRHLVAGTRIESMRSGRHGCVSYASKYAAKQDQKEVPDFIINCGRFWGVSGLRTVMAADTMVTEQAMKNPAVSRAVESLRQLLRDLVAKREIQYNKVDGGVICFFIRSEAARVAIQGECWKLEAIVLANGGFSPYLLPHLETAENAEGLLQPSKSQCSPKIYAERSQAYIQGIG